MKNELENHSYSLDSGEKKCNQAHFIEELELQGDLHLFFQSLSSEERLRMQKYLNSIVDTK